MASLLVVFGSGPGISQATAQRFAAEGYAVALVGRDPDHLQQGVERLAADGIDAHAYQGDASRPDSVRDVLARIRAAQGPVTALLWTAFRGGAVHDVLDAAPEEVVRTFDVGVVGLLTAVQTCLPDLEDAHGSVLVANGAAGDDSERMDAVAAMLGIDGTALESAAKSKVVGLLATRLRDRGVAVGQVTVAGSVGGTATASATPIDPAEIAELFWAVASRTAPVRAVITE